MMSHFKIIFLMLTKSNSRRWLYMGAVVGVLSLSWSAYAHKEEIKMSYIRHTYKMNALNVEIGSPKGYDVVVDQAGSYVFDLGGNEITHFGVDAAIDSSWGWGTKITGTEDNSPLPGGVNLRWYSVAEDQFYEARLTINRESIINWFEYGEWSPYSEKRKYFLRDERTSLVINMLPGGKAVFWLNSGDRVYFLGLEQAKKVEVDWTEFGRYAFMIKQPDRKAYREESLSYDDYAQVREQIKTGTLPLDAKPWTQLLALYSWRLIVNEPYVMTHYEGVFQSAEIFTETAEQAQRLRFRPMLSRLNMGVIDPVSHEKQLLELGFNQEEMRQAVRQVSGVDGVIPFTLHIDYDAQAGTVKAILQSENERVVVNVVDFDVSDFPQDE